MIKLLDAGLGKIYGSVGNVTGLAIGLFAIFIVLDLVLRKFGLPLIEGLQEIIEYSLYVVVFLGAPWVLRLGAHIRVDFLSSLLGERNVKTLDVMMNVLGLIISLLLVYYGMRNLMEAYQFGSAQRQVFVVMEWHLLIIFVLSFSLCAVEFLLRMWRGHPVSEETA
ncbi:TRAP transporter small permease subunit [Sneathiella chungangensis]|uniref:TRAP transporter small permease protein n=1 Tax=Sneathiella chungangensis TaxID=1418234 RepID=A0A845MII9_9PROT|nr:TRAP transporter small permease [Sneathiella chungangensis]MZR23230.1 TRAP transporter small permease subunit [Sneathiella chungangensis]